MRVTRPLFMAALFLSLANPAIAQTDPHHPEGADTPSATTGTPAGNIAQLPAPPAANATAQCPDMMGMMKGGGGAAIPMMQMHMMTMMQMHLQLMQQMQSGGMMQPGAGGSPQMQMMEMMRSMQMMQMDMMRMMRQMQMDIPAPEAPAEGDMP
ncbi:hypothetical protein [Aminobacter ciceronei]|uniref:DUF305 domain-containing protein n=1 Tax=Aminobacter ciceronei TaxID=150723 RepID=A0ABR6C3A0_9HYPH|nr:hypothetical protein [Aminobacter ciceronei]MBA8905563.1 hypothetical protein [Aminobacter ciceronei]MBA9019138.1 hypothetical protein [Aminobacter ciceronei]